MAVNLEAYAAIKQQLSSKNVTLVAVSKTKPAEDIQALYNAGQRDFGENYVQELADKQAVLPTDIHWHFIGHLQSNKVKYVAPFVHLIHGVDSLKLLAEINKQALKINRIINCLLQVHIAQEETKFGFDEAGLLGLDMSQVKQLTNIRVLGLMGMASFTEDTGKIRSEFRQLKAIYDKAGVLFKEAGFHFTTLSMGMSSDYAIAMEEGSTMARIGSLLFGARSMPHAS